MGRYDSSEEGDRGYRGEPRIFDVRELVIRNLIKFEYSLSEREGGDYHALCRRKSGRERGF